MLKNRQLYKENNFNLPRLQQIIYNPFKKQQSIKSSNDLQLSILNQQIAQFKPTHTVAYNSQFEIIAGGENMYPLFMDVSSQNLVICSQTFFLVIRIQVNQSILQNSTSFLKSNVKLGIYHKVVLNEPPTCLKAKGNHVYFGMSSGKILCYDITRKTLTGTCDDFMLPIMQIQIISENQIIAIDCAGNIRFVQFSHKTFLDKIIKTLIHTKDTSVIFKAGKRQKIKKKFSNLLNKKDGVNSQNKNQQNGKQSLQYGVQGFPYFYTRFAIPGQHLSDLVHEDTRLIAVLRRNNLFILTCNHAFQLIQEKSLMDSQIEEVGMMEFGVGGFQNSNNTHLLLVFSTRNRLEYYKGIQVQQSYQWIHVSSTQFGQKIIDGKFISNNLILILTQKSVCICNVSQNPEKIYPFALDKFNYVDFFIQQEGLNFDKGLINRNILKIINDKNEFLCLEGKRLLTGKIDSWKDYLQRYVDEQKFNEAIVMSLKIYNRELRKLCNINQKQQTRNTQMKQFFQKVTLTYISFEIKKQNFNKKHMLSLCIHFLVKTESFQYLFTTISQIIKSLNLFGEFLEVLQTFVQKGQIKVMTQQILDQIIKIYKSKEQKQKIEALVRNFDLTMMQKSLLLIICLRQHLYESMIQICSQHNDFVSPVLKLCGISFTQQVQQNQKIKIKQIIFFYLKQCLNGHNTEYGNDQAYIQMLIQLINFLFIPNTLEMLVSISCSDTIKIVNMFFEAKILQYILQNEGKFFIKKNDYVQMNVFQENCINQFKVYQKMLSTLIYLMDHSTTNTNQEKKIMNNQNQSIEKQKCQNKIYYQVNKFLCFLLLKNQFPFVAKYKRNCLLFFIQNAHSAFLDQIQENQSQKASQNQILLNAYFMRLMDSLLRSLQEKPDQIQKVLKLLLDRVIISQNSNLLSQGKCYILHEQGKYSQVMQLYLKMSNKTLKYKVFQYLNYNLNEYQPVSIEFIKNLDTLIKLNRQKSLHLLNSLKYEFCDHEKIILNLNSYPEIQLQYIQKILNSTIQSRYNTQYNEIKRKKLALIHLQIVVKYKFSQLDNYIQKMQYPLEEAYKICEQKQSITGKAYILIKSGRNMEGLLMLCQIFLKTCDQIFGNLARKKPLQSQKKKILDQQLNKLLQTCQQQFLTDQQRGQQIWQKCIKKIFKYLRICPNMKNQAIPNPIKQILRQIVQKSLKKMFSQLNSDFFINKFCKIFPHLPFSVFIIAFGQLFDRMQFVNQLQFLSMQLLQKDDITGSKKIFKQNYKGFPVRLQCQVCLQSISQSSEKQWIINSYSCGHCFHKMCLIDERNNFQKKILKQGVCIKCRNDIESFAQFNGLVVEYYRTHQRKEPEMKRKITKLNDYQLNQGIVFNLPLFQTQN